MTVLDELLADRRDDDLPPEAGLFDRFLGRWRIANRLFSAETGEWTSSTAEWAFARILAGHGIQDVLIGVDGPWGTTVRTWDEEVGWRIVWFCPRASEHCVLHVVETDGDGIRLEGAQADGRPIRWEFTSTAPDRFAWDGWCSDDRGATWWHEQHMDANRQSPATS